MKIGPMYNQELLSVKSRNKQDGAEVRQFETEKKDSVEISQSGREKLKEAADLNREKVINDTEINEPISSKLARIRNKVEAGHYDLDEIQSKIVEKLTDTIIKDIDNNKKME